MKNMEMMKFRKDFNWFGARLTREKIIEEYSHVPSYIKRAIS